MADTTTTSPTGNPSEPSNKGPMDRLGQPAEKDPDLVETELAGEAARNAGQRLRAKGIDPKTRKPLTN